MGVNSYTVQWVSRKVTKYGDDYLSLKLDDTYVNFFEPSDVGILVEKGQTVSCTIVQKGQYHNGYNLKIVTDVRESVKNQTVKPVPKDDIDELIVSDDEFFQSKPFKKPKIQTIVTKVDGSFKTSNVIPKNYNRSRKPGPSRRKTIFNPYAKGTFIDKRGYRRFRTNRKLEHRYIMEQHLSRKLRRQEVVHHINRNKLDNRVENLQVFPNNDEHMELHRVENDWNSLCGCLGSFFLILLRSLR